MGEKEQIKWEDWFYYDETSPSCLRWKVDRYGGPKHCTLIVSAGSIAGSRLASGHWQVMLLGASYKVHRIVWELHNGVVPDGLVVDHIDGDGTSNKIGNLRVVIRAVNSRNRKRQKTNLSGVTGVSFATKRSTNSERTYWVAQWYDLQGKFRQKVFSIAKLGNDGAFEAAKRYREQQIALLNFGGAEYTERHGT